MKLCRVIKYLSSKGAFALVSIYNINRRYMSQVYLSYDGELWLAKSRFRQTASRWKGKYCYFETLKNTHFLELKPCK